MIPENVAAHLNTPDNASSMQQKLSGHLSGGGDPTWRGFSALGWEEGPPQQEEDKTTRTDSKRPSWLEAALGLKSS